MEIIPECFFAQKVAARVLLEKFKPKVATDYANNDHRSFPDEPPYSWGVSIPATGLSDYVLAGYFNSELRTYQERRRHTVCEFRG